MKRALAILMVCGLFGFAGMAQFSGEWSTTLNVLPSLGLEESTLTLKYTFNGWTLTSISTFDPTFSKQHFKLDGTIGPSTVKGEMVFDPAETDEMYDASFLGAKVDFAGVSFTMGTVHLMPGESYSVAKGWLRPQKTTITNALDVPIFRYGLIAELAPVTINVQLVDECTGAEFLDATLIFDDLSLCCGITYDFELYFTKANGFEYAEFSFSDLFSLCCGISFDASVKFGVDYKTVSLTPSIDLGAECLDLGLDVGWSDFTVTDIKIDYIGISCEYGDCLSFEAGTAFLREYSMVVEYVDPKGNVVQTASVTLFTRTAPSGWGLKDGIHFVYVNNEIDDAIWWMEYEYAKFSFCGPGCCGGEYTVDVSLYWAAFYDIWENGAPQVPPVQVFPTLFGLSRVVGSFKVPVMDNLTITMDITHWLLTGITEFDVGWTFTF